MTKYPDLFAALAAPFANHELKQRTQAGHQLTYITVRTAMNRLDDVLGPESWWDEYTPSENSVLCRLTIRLPDGTTLTKCDAGGYAGMSDHGDDDKSGYSDALKRTCVKFGVARYLYRDGVPQFAMERYGEVPNDPPPTQAHRPPPPAPSHQNGNGGQHHGDGNGHGERAPRNGRGLFAWCKEMEQKHEVGIIKFVNDWGKSQDLPPRMVDWDEDQVARAFAEVTRKFQLPGKAEGERPADGATDRPGAFPRNHSGHGRGQYASPEQVELYRENIRQYVEDRNQQWLDSCTRADGTLPEGVGEYLRTHQVTAHLLKWGLRLGRLADVGVAYDAETGRPTAAVSVVQAEKYVAILAHRHRDEMLVELNRYAADQAVLARRALRDTDTSDDLATTEAGSRG